MLENFKNFFKKKVDQRDVILTIHGFGVRRENEMDELVEYAKNHSMEIVTFNLFEIEGKKDDDYKIWVKRAEEMMQKMIQENRRIYLVGFSMGGVIASHLASHYPIEKLILVAPAFIHFSLENYTNLAIKKGKQLISSSENKAASMPSTYYSAFLNCVKAYRNDISKVLCPVLILQGDCDEVIPVRSSEWAYEQIPHFNKRCVFLHEGKHRLLSDEKVKDVAFLLMDDFIHDKLLKSQD